MAQCVTQISAIWRRKRRPSTANCCSGQSKPAFMAANQKFLFSLVLFLEALVIAFALMHRFPPSGDDYSYLYQAKLFASGELYAQDALYDAANPLHNCVDTSCIADNHGRRFSKYPPGWPAFLALGVLADRKSTRLNSSHRCISYAVF